ncbi:MAG: type VI secretion system contractile sheath large subunit [Pseudomonadota bacterium]|nr:type VI secretion system contractile sheath large subunit [Pseudomonadota bacterium]
MSRATMNTGGIPISTASDQDQPTLVRNKPCHILVLADFSGRDHRDQNDAANLDQRRIFEITRDNIDDVFVRMGVTLDLPIADEPIKFLELDDLHPDFIYERVDLFSQFRALKRKLKKRDSFAAAAAEIQSWGASSQAASTTASPSQTATAQSSTANADVLDMLLHSRRAQAEAAHSIKGLIQQIVAPYVIPSPDPREAELLQTVDQAASHLLRKILHSSAFQDIESAWRGLYWLLKQLETDQQLRLFVADVSLQEIIADNEAHEDSTTQLHKLLLENRVGEGSVPFSVIVADYQLQDEVSHCEALANLASTAADSHAVLVSGGSERMAGCPNLTQVPDPEHWYLHRDGESDFTLMWQAIREQDYAQYAVLACPRFMLRLPYGANTSPLEAFDFEELPQDGQHPYYLWGNGAWLLAAQLGNYFTGGGWSADATRGSKVTQLPLHVYKEHGQSQVKPCAEINMLDTTATALMAHGLMPLRSVRDEDSVVIPPLRAISSVTPQVLGPWSEVPQS